MKIVNLIIFLIVFSSNLFAIENKIQNLNQLPICEYKDSNEIGDYGRLVFPYKCFGRVKIIHGGDFDNTFLIYNGEWLNLKKHGRGILTDTNNRTYIGEFKYDKFHGIGAMSYEENHPFYKEYIGEWKAADFEGNGTLIYKNGNKYIGEFKESMLLGQGKMIFNNNKVYLEYSGSWDRNVFNGKGVLLYHNGLKYSSNWRDGIRDKENIVTYPNGTVIEGIFENGPFGWGIYKIPNLRYFFDAVYYWYYKITN